MCLALKEWAEVHRSHAEAFEVVIVLADLGEPGNLQGIAASGARNKIQKSLLRKTRRYSSDAPAGEV